MKFKITNKLNPISKNLFTLEETIDYLKSYDDTNFNDYGGLSEFKKLLKEGKCSIKKDKEVFWSYGNEILITK